MVHFENGSEVEAYIKASGWDVHGERMFTESGENEPLKVGQKLAKVRTKLEKT